MPPTTNQCIEASSAIASWIWVPFGSPYSLKDDLKAKHPNYTYQNMLWEPLEGTGLLCTPVNSSRRIETFFFFYHSYCTTEQTEEGLREAYRAIGYCLYIKAGLLDRLYSSSTAETHSPNTLTWSIALANHVVELLQFWDAANLGPDEQIYIISSLIKLINTLLDASQCGTILEPIKSSQLLATATQNTSSDVAGPRDRLEALIKAGVLPVLSGPFSSLFQAQATIASTNKYAPGKTEWHDNVARTIERLARTFPGIWAEKTFATAINDTLQYFGKTEWVFKQEGKTSSSDGGNDYKVHHGNDNQADFCSDLVTYYEAKALQNLEESLPMLELVKRLRDDMGARDPPISPRVESPVDVRIDMTQ